MQEFDRMKELRVVVIKTAGDVGRGKFATFWTRWRAEPRPPQLQGDYDLYKPTIIIGN